MVLSALAAALALIAGSQDPDAARYALDVTVVHSGVQTVGARTILVEDGAASITIQDADGVFEMNAQLSPVQGDGEGDSLAFSVTIMDRDAEAQEPSLLIRRGGDASIVIGNEGPDGVMFEGLKIQLSPLSAGR